MGVEGLLGAGRVAAARLMTDTCTITRVTGRSFNETTLVYSDTTTTVYSGPCRVKALNQGDLVVDAGQRQAMTREYLLSIPVADAFPEVGDRVAITASQFDTAQAGLVLTVVGSMHGSQQTARRLRCQEVTA